jgi:UDP-arabinose 4-epimerase
MEAEICPAAPATPPVLVSDSSKAREPLGWTPSYPELDPQIAHDWTWLRDEMPNM